MSIYWVSWCLGLTKVLLFGSMTSVGAVCSLCFYCSHSFDHEIYYSCITLVLVFEELVSLCEMNTAKYNGLEGGFVLIRSCYSAMSMAIGSKSDFLRILREKVIKILKYTSTFLQVVDSSLSKLDPWG